jgi:hypothetical protein
MLPMKTQVRKAIWAAVNPHTGVRLIDEAFPLELRKRTLDDEMFIEFLNGSTWQAVGSDGFDGAVGSPPAGIVYSEYALSNPAAHDILRPIILENDGWEVFITTPRGDNHAKQLYDYAVESDEWFAEKLTVDDTGRFTQAQLDSELGLMQNRHGIEDGQALFDQEYRCSFVAPLIGSYYARLIEQAEKSGRIGALSIDHTYPVHSAWDLGVGDSNAIWCFQIKPDGIAVVDYYEASGQGIEFYADWLDSKGYKGQDLLPHDAAQRVPVGNPPRTRIEIMLNLGRKPVLVPLHKVPDGISAARMTLRACSFDSIKCAKGLRALRNYRRQWSEDRKTFVDAPLHDWASHGADGFRTLAMGWATMPTIVPVKPFEINTRFPTLNELMNEGQTDRRI